MSSNSKKIIPILLILGLCAFVLVNKGNVGKQFKNRFNKTEQIDSSKIEGGYEFVLEPYHPGIIKKMFGPAPTRRIDSVLRLSLRAYNDGGDYVGSLKENFEKHYSNEAIIYAIADHDFLATLKNGSLASNKEVFEQFEKVLDNALQSSKKKLNARLKVFGYSYFNIIENDKDQLVVTIKGKQDVEQIKNDILVDAELSFWEVYPNREVIHFFEKIDANYRLVNGIKDMSEEIPEDSIKLEISENEFEKQNPLLSKIILNSDDAGHIFDGPVAGYIKHNDVLPVLSKLIDERYLKNLPDDLYFAVGDPVDIEKEFFTIYGLKRSRNGQPIMYGDIIEEIRPVENPYGENLISLAFKEPYIKRWRELTAKAAIQRDAIAIYANNKVISAPTVQAEIPNGRCEVSGGFTKEEAEELALKLNATGTFTPFLLKNIREVE